MVRTDIQQLVVLASVVLSLRHERLSGYSLKVKRFIQLDFSSRVEAYPAGVREVYPQSTIGAKTQPLLIQVPSAGVCKLRDVIVRDNSAAMLLEDGIYLNEARRSPIEGVNSAGGLLVQHGMKLGVVRTGHSEVIESGVWLGGLGSFNWYHWVIEILPKILAYERVIPDAGSPNLPYLVPHVVQLGTSFLESFQAVSPSSCFKVLRKDVNYRVKSLYVSDPPNWQPFNWTAGTLPTHSDNAVRHDLITQISSRIKQNVSSIAVDTPLRRIFLWRENDRRGYNQDDALEVARHYGFTAVDVGMRSLQDQVNVFSNADVVIGATGAAWTGLIFCSPGTQGLIWGPKLGSSFIGYSTLAAAFKVDLRYIHTDQEPARNGTFYSVPFQLDTKQLDDALKILSPSWR